MTQNRALRIKEVAERTGLAVSTLYNLASAQRRGDSRGHAVPMPFRHVGRQLVVMEADLAEWMDAEEAAWREANGAVQERGGGLSVVPEPDPA